MVYSPTRKGRWAIKTQTGFGTAETSFAAADVIECTIQLPQTIREALQPEIMKMGYAEAPLHPGSKAGGEHPFEIPLHGWMDLDDLGDPPTADPTVNPDALMLMYALGAASQGGYNADLDAGGNTTTVAVSAGFDAGLVGHAINVPIVGGSRVTTWVTAATDGGGGAGTYTVLAMPAAPLDTGVIYGSNTIYMPKVHGTPANGLTLQWLGSSSDAQVRLKDGIVTGTVSIQLTPKMQPMMSATLVTSAWDLVGSGGAPAPAKHRFSQMPALLNSQGARMLVNGSAFKVQDARLEIEITTQEVRDHNAQEGVALYVVTDRRVRLVTTTLKDSFTALREPGDTSVGTVQIDSTFEAGRSFSLLFPSGIILEQEALEVADNLIGVTTTFGADFTELDGDATADPANTIARFAML